MQASSKLLTYWGSPCPPSTWKYNVRKGWAEKDWLKTELKLLFNGAKVEPKKKEYSFSFFVCIHALEFQQVNERSVELFTLPPLSFSSLSHHAVMQPTSWSHCMWPSSPCWACWFSFCWFACCPAWSKWRRGPRGLLPWRRLPRTLAKRMRERLSDRSEGQIYKWQCDADDVYPDIKWDLDFWRFIWEIFHCLLGWFNLWYLYTFFG